jgi:hypothetical protein
MRNWKAIGTVIGVIIVLVFLILVSMFAEKTGGSLPLGSNIVIDFGTIFVLIFVVYLIVLLIDSD